MTSNQSLTQTELGQKLLKLSLQELALNTALMGLPVNSNRKIAHVEALVAFAQAKPRTFKKYFN